MTPVCNCVSIFLSFVYQRYVFVQMTCSMLFCGAYLFFYISADKIFVKLYGVK